MSYIRAIVEALLVAAFAAFVAAVLVHWKW